jgi:hypothetical protein
LEEREQRVVRAAEFDNSIIASRFQASFLHLPVSLEKEFYCKGNPSTHLVPFDEKKRISSPLIYPGHCMVQLSDISSQGQDWTVLN